MINNIERIQEEARSKISETKDLRELDQLRVEYLGKKGVVTSELHKLGNLDPDQRREMGAVVNRAKTFLESQIETRRLELKRSDLEQELAHSEPLDITLPGQYVAPRGTRHPLTAVQDQIIDILRRVGYSVASGPEIETEFYNFEALNTPENHPARDMQDTFYLEGQGLLRSHTSPVQIRTMKNNPPPLQIIAPGRVYRSDYDPTHSPMFHQMEGLMVDEGISFAHLKGTIQYLVNELFGKRPVRFRPSFFPFTEPSAEMDMLFNGDWLEIGGCGMVHPNVFRAAGYDPDEVSGFAFGLGIERIAMLKYGVTDLRSFFENDLRMLEQF